MRKRSEGIEKFTVFINGMKFWVRCGVYEEERTLGVQLKVSVALKSQEFVDYQELFERVKSKAQNSYVYLEDFQKAILEELLERWNLDEVIIKVVKLSVPFQHNFDEVGVELKWKRKN